MSESGDESASSETQDVEYKERRFTIQGMKLWNS